MSSSRKRRRRMERERARRPGRSRRLSLTARLGLVIAGIVLAAGGVALVAAGSSSNASRLGRLAGILILVGIVLIGVGAIGKM